MSHEYKDEWLINWAAKIANCKIFGLPIFQGRPYYTQITTINIAHLHVHIKMGHTILLQCHGNHIKVKLNV